ncbi:Panacea domain-containing protein [Clostridium perfringens]|uniref:Panacea domain-containing protein n=1 Tax=Clostridium perfringens TaxID=1502 RepID=UPI0024BBF425|nr:type II toxin-antitoxin system antitoxin SocA domain-containing protein [Clostridium perfringens]EJT6166370.1 DUF4065 domain-containing protein [Clostridium perfringens]EJT6657836.1 DUF4065 domain-containing protein [Clostridium perfringens]
MLGYDDFSKLILSYGSFSHKKLQKLSYYVYSWYLTLYGEKIADVNFEAWVHGPVSPEIYSLYKNYGWKDIPKYTGCIKINDIINSRVEAIIEEYIDLDANELEKRTHKELPWRLAREGYEKYESSNEIIDDDIIINYYESSELFNVLSHN